MISRIITVTGLSLLLSSSAVWAADVKGPVKKPVVVTISKASAPVAAPAMVRCYTPQQYRAEQAIRYHTQLMVAGMLCQNHAGPQVYSQYQGFTLRNQNVITRAENKLIEFFRLQHKAAPERELHSLRTNMANEISMRAMQQSLGSYCGNAVPRVKQAGTMQPREFENYLMKVDMRQTSTVPLCNRAPILRQIKATIPAQEMVAPKPSVKPVVKTVKLVEKTGKK
ncbi:MAG TPA: hypothetical protein VGF14_08250 [Alphaproteobacteria bacterium]